MVVYGGAGETAPDYFGGIADNHKGGGVYFVDNIFYFRDFR